MLDGALGEGGEGGGNVMYGEGEGDGCYGGDEV